MLSSQPLLLGFPPLYFKQITIYLLIFRLAPFASCPTLLPFKIRCTILPDSIYPSTPSTLRLRNAPPCFTSPICIYECTPDIMSLDPLESSTFYLLFTSVYLYSGILAYLFHIRPLTSAPSPVSTSSNQLFTDKPTLAILYPRRPHPLSFVSIVFRVPPSLLLLSSHSSLDNSISRVCPSLLLLINRPVSSKVAPQLCAYVLTKHIISYIRFIPLP